MLYALSIRPEPFSMASDSMQVFTPEEQKQLPKHIAIIMDGNGRWAKSLGKPRLFGHRNGVKNVRDIVNAARAIGIPIRHPLCLQPRKPKPSIRGKVRPHETSAGIH